MTWLAIMLAVLNSWLFAEGARLQHSTCVGRLSLAAACREPRWLAGLGLIAAGAGLQVTALQLAPVTVVQPAGVLGIAASVLWRLRLRGGRPGLRTVGALAAIVVGVGAFAVTAAAHTVLTPITTAAQIQAGVAVGAVALTCRTAGKALGGRGRCLVLSVGAGAAYGYASVLGRAAIEHYSESGLTPGLLGTLAGLVAAVLTGVGLLQRAYADGPPETTTATVTITDPMVAVLIGVALLGEAPALTAQAAGAALVCAALAVTGMITLARDLHAAGFAPRAAPAPVAVSRPGSPACPSPSGFPADDAPPSPRTPPSDVTARPTGTAVPPGPRRVARGPSDSVLPARSFENRGHDPSVAGIEEKEG
ncbi:hypothetical protein [Streptomyces sp. NPDC020747]|uniref:hypothetical protein n=1 Tax=Streptomyces sp. NPDC020747 TaxID=3365086 RepID=UPI0037B128F1